MRFPYQKVAEQDTSVSFRSGAGMAELVDAPDSKSGGVKPVRVRVSLPAKSLLPQAFAAACHSRRNPLPCIALVSAVVRCLPL